jgi:hypothetical protein
MPDGWRPLSNLELEHVGRTSCCPMCRTGKLLAGPEGGGSQNLMCHRCGTEYCYGGWTGLQMPRNPSRASTYGLDQLPGGNVANPIFHIDRVDRNPGPKPSPESPSQRRWWRWLADLWPW